MTAENSTNQMNAFVVVVAILLGFVGLVFVISDPGEGWYLRMALATGFYLLTGAVIGYAYPKGWLLAMITAWSAVLMGGFIVLMSVARYGSGAFGAVEPPFITSGLIMVLGSLGLTFFGAFLGRSVRLSLARTAPG